MGEQGLRRLTDQVRRVLDTHLAPGATVVCGCSGGADSVALVELTRRARPDLRLIVVCVRHGLREDSADVAAARAAAERLDVALQVVAVAVSDGRGPEDAARRARHAALLHTARDHGAAAVLLGHTAEDQAETVLLRIARGTGARGLAGMAEASSRDGVVLLRPLLGSRRAEVRAVVADLPTAEDPTNADPQQRRARARHEALPALGRLRPDEGDAVPALVRLADNAREDAAALAALLDLTPSVRYGRAVLALLPDGLRGDRGGAADDAVRAVLASLLRRAWPTLPRPDPAAETIPLPPRAALRRAVELELDGSADLPGPVRVIRIPDGLVLRRLDVPLPPPRPLLRDVPVGVPGHAHALVLRTAVDPNDTATPDRLGGRAGDGRGRPPSVAAPWQRLLPVPEPGTDGVHVRFRGPQGLRAARRVLQHLPAAVRDEVPIVCAADGTPLLVGDVPILPPRLDRPVMRVDAVPLAEPLA